jgi:ATP synthase protein I
MTTIPKPPLTRVAIYQLAALLPASGLLLLLDTVLAYSVLVGGLVQIVPQAWFARQAYKYSGAQQASLVVRAMYRGETGKVVLTATLMAVLFTLYKQWNFFALFMAYITMIPLQLIFTKRALHKQ